MKSRLLVAAAGLWLASAATAAAETVVLVQGYLGSAGSWRLSGIAPTLHNHGWQDGGHLSLAPGGVLKFGPDAKAEHRFVTIDLPTEAPTVIQSDMLAHYVAELRRQTGEQRVIVVGHSAGGVVGRLAMVRHPASGIDGLVTIASPHLGTGAADMGRFIGSTPLSWLTPLVGLGTINRSQALYHDLSHERPWNLLGWLNRQPHPEASYVSVVRVRNGVRPDLGDSIAYGYSQDMNVVPALQGRAQTLFSPGDHGLRPDDGLLLVDILRRLSPST